MRKEVAAFITPALFLVAFSPDKPYDRQQSFLNGNTFTQEQLEKTGLTEQFLGELNNMRRQNGLPAVEKDAILEEAAAIRVRQMITGSFSHVDEDGNSLIITVLKDLGVPYERAYGEILARTTAADIQVLREIVDSFKKSCTHRAFFNWSGAGSVGAAGRRSPDGFFYFSAIFSGDPQSITSWPVCEGNLAS